MKVISRSRITRAYRHARVRRKVSGTGARPRMALAKSNRAMYVQFIDDVRGVTLASASSLHWDKPNNRETARLLGQTAAQEAIAKGITSVVVDRGGFKYHGRIQAVVEAAVEAGLRIRSKEEA